LSPSIGITPANDCSVTLEIRHSLRVHYGAALRKALDQEASGPAAAHPANPMPGANWHWRRKPLTKRYRHPYTIHTDVKWMA